MKPIVSVIVPYYHGASRLDTILAMMERNAQVLREKRKEEMELLFVNDSPEEALVISEQSLYSVKVLPNPKNMGIHASRVNGLIEAEGEYVHFLDQDDLISDECLYSQLERIGKADFVIGNGYERQPDGTKKLIFSSAKKQQCAADLNCHLFYNNLIRSPGQVLIRKNSIPSKWSENILKNNGSDDAFLWILMLSSGRSAAINETPVYEHVYTGNNTSENTAGMLRSKKEAAKLLKGIVSPVGLWAIQRRAEYFCLKGSAHAFRYADVGLLRKIYAMRNIPKG